MWCKFSCDLKKGKRKIHWIFKKKIYLKRERRKDEGERKRLKWNYWWINHDCVVFNKYFTFKLKMLLHCLCSLTWNNSLQYLFLETSLRRWQMVVHCLRIHPWNIHYKEMKFKQSKRKAIMFHRVSFVL